MLRPSTHYRKRGNYLLTFHINWHFFWILLLLHPLFFCEEQYCSGVCPLRFAMRVREPTVPFCSILSTAPWTQSFFFLAIAIYLSCLLIISATRMPSAIWFTFFMSLAMLLARAMRLRPVSRSGCFLNRGFTAWFPLTCPPILGFFIFISNEL